MVASTSDQDGHPPLGWSDTFAYLVLPVLLVVSQYISVQIMQSSQVGCFLDVHQHVTAYRGILACFHLC